MKVTLHLALSADGFIATPLGDSDWVSPVDSELFEERIKEAGCIVVGRKTFEQYQGELYPVDGVVNIVLSHNADLELEGAHVVSSPEEAIEIAKENNCLSILLAGGGHTAAAFLKANLIKEIYFSIHPIILGQGIKPFEGEGLSKKLKLIDSRKLEEGLAELHYQTL